MVPGDKIETPCMVKFEIKEIEPGTRWHPPRVRIETIINGVGKSERWYEVGEANEAHFRFEFH